MFNKDGACNKHNILSCTACRFAEVSRKRDLEDMSATILASLIILGSNQAKSLIGPTGTYEDLAERAVEFAVLLQRKVAEHLEKD